MNKLDRLLSLVITLVVTGCSFISPTPAVSTDQYTSQPSSRTATPVSTPGQGALIVFAAASLSDAFQEIGKNFESENPGVKVRFNFTGSQIARMQIEQGAAADIFASADPKNMDQLAADGLVSADKVQNFATNRLVVVLPQANPGDIHMLTDLAKPGLKIILADASVPAGNYSRQVLSRLSENPAYGPEFIKKVMENVVSNETDIRQVVTKVELGEADAGIVYVSDAVATPALTTITIPEEFNVVASYPIAMLNNTSEPELAEEFIKSILLPTGQAILEKWGFKGATQ